MLDRDEDAAAGAEHGRNWPATLALGAALIYLVAAIAVVALLANGSVRAGGATTETAAIFILVAVSLTPFIALLLVALLLQRRGYDHAERLRLVDARHARAQAAAEQVADQLHGFERLLDLATGRLEALRATIHDEIAGLDAALGRLTAGAATLGEASTETRRAGAAIEAILPDVDRRAREVVALLDSGAAGSAKQLGEIETLLAATHGRHEEARLAGDTAAGSLAAVLAGIEAASEGAARRLADQSATVTQAVDAALDRTTSALDATRDGVHAQSSALLASVDQARVALDHIGGETARAIGRRLEALLATADQLGQRLAEQDARSRNLVETIERSFAILDAKLANAASTGAATLGDLSGRMDGVRDQVHALHVPFGETGTALGELEGQVARLQVVGGTAAATLGDALPAAAAGLTALSGELSRLTAEAHALVTPVTDGERAIHAAATALAMRRDETESATGRLVGELEAARHLVEQIGSATESGALAGARQLIDVLGRVREVAATTAGTMRETLEGVVLEAEAALDRAGSERAEHAFATPIRAQLASVEEASARAGEAAQAAVERISGRLVGLTAAVSTVEARIDEADAHFDQRHREDIARRATGIIEALNANSVDIARLLSVDIADTAWEAYLRGDRGIFARRAVRLIDGGTARAIRRNYDRDPDVREQVTRYIEIFESLMRRVLADREGRALGVTLLGSDVGKLYVALAQAVERLR